MKLFTLFVLAASLVLVGCEKKPEDTSKPATPPTTTNK